MKLEEVLGYLEQMVGLKLQPINESNESLVILEVDRENSRYTVDKTQTTRKRTRPFVELQKILSALNQKGFTSVDQALGALARVVISQKLFLPTSHVLNILSMKKRNTFT